MIEGKGSVFGVVGELRKVGRARVQSVFRRLNEQVLRGNLQYRGEGESPSSWKQSKLDTLSRWFESSRPVVRVLALSSSTNTSCEKELLSLSTAQNL